ncbi:MAG: hypothetical protein ABSC89_01915 [Verrucomicrobiota bacterium]|jgi:hypothetical protein
MPTPERKKIREKRITMLNGAYEMMKGRYREIKENTYFSPSIAAVAIEDYLVMRDGLIARDKIPGGIQWHKVAGLMASSIGKNKPIQLVPERTDSKSYRHSMDNEVLAALHGLAVCAEGKSESHIDSVLNVSNFRHWFDDFIHVLHNNPSNSEAFVLAFETLSLTYFPDNLGHFE